MYYYCIRRGLQQADAFDVSQDVLSKLRGFQYDPNRGRFRAWLGTVARNQVNEFWRRQKPARQIETADSRASENTLDWDRLSRAHILDQALQRIRGEFNEDSWAVFEAIALSTEVVDGEKRFVWKTDGEAQQIAAQFGKPVEWVYKTKSRILKRLRDEVVYLAEEMAIIP